ncbi:MAG: hypothetical protein EZS28_011871 [Streblomastix strix]|uniref:Uncharacterized protein n=1 Tax=Streblomastix strix TaxID=222440 RepID=A0A5J4WCH7_9EUKA|nr:MAG: hypothetical protein EZS28_011871 [Streblomastix strix]
MIECDCNAETQEQQIHWLAGIEIVVQILEQLQTRQIQERNQYTNQFSKSYNLKQGQLTISSYQLNEYIFNWRDDIYQQRFVLNGDGEIGSGQLDRTKINKENVLLANKYIRLLNRRITKLGECRERATLSSLLFLLPFDNSIILRFAYLFIWPITLAFTHAVSSEQQYDKQTYLNIDDEIKHFPLIPPSNDYQLFTSHSSEQQMMKLALNSGAQILNSFITSFTYPYLSVLLDPVKQELLSALTILASQDKRFVLVLGKLGEIGSDFMDYHFDIPINRRGAAAQRDLDGYDDELNNNLFNKNIINLQNEISSQPQTSIQTSQNQPSNTTTSNIINSFSNSISGKSLSSAAISSSVNSNRQQEDNQKISLSAGIGEDDEELGLMLVLEYEPRNERRSYNYQLNNKQQNQQDIHYQQNEVTKQIKEDSIQTSISVSGGLKGGNPRSGTQTSKKKSDDNKEKDKDKDKQKTKEKEVTKDKDKPKEKDNEHELDSNADDSCNYPYNNCNNINKHILQ